MALDLEAAKQEQEEELYALQMIFEDDLKMLPEVRLHHQHVRGLAKVAGVDPVG
mgnify:CR=1 FL=1